MRVTLMGALTLFGLAALLVYAGYELRRVIEGKSVQLHGIPKLR